MSVLLKDRNFLINMKAEFDNQADFKIVFFGTPDFSVPCLISLAKAGYGIKAVITQPDRAKGRGRIFSPSPVKIKAQELGLEVLQPDKLNKNFIDKLTEIKAHLFVVVAYGEFLPLDLINLPNYKTVNIHPSLLPKYRGPSPIQWSLLNGDGVTGNSLMLIDKQMDHGPILNQSQIKIAPDETTESLREKLSQDGAQLLITSLPGYIQEKIKPREQDHTKATFSKLINKQDGLIDWHDTAQNILNKIRAYNPWPVVEIKIEKTSPPFNSPPKLGGATGGESSLMSHSLKGCFSIKIYKARISDRQFFPGQIEIDKINRQVYIGSGTKALEILELQLPGKKRLASKELVNGLK